MAGGDWRQACQLDWKTVCWVEEVAACGGGNPDSNKIEEGTIDHLEDALTLRHAFLTEFGTTI